MAYRTRRLAPRLTVLAAALAPLLASPAWAQQIVAGGAEITELPEIDVLGTAEQAWKQAPGVSIVSQQQLENAPASDIAEVLRKQPGVNLTGNSTSGQRGNNRQIDLRGMGPENTLILIDGKPVNSRKAVRYGWRGERDTRGDMNWVPAEAIERVEVLRGPAAARYGNGAAGGVVNIITKGVPEQFGGSASLYLSRPQDSVDGDSRRASASIAGPIADNFGYRITASASKTDADAWNINQGHASTRTGPFRNTFPAGREGVRNRDLNARLSYKPAPGHTLDLDLAFARQGNIYTGDTQNTNNYTVNAQGQLVPTSQRVQDALGSETNRMYRSSYGLTHKGRYDGGVSSLAYLQYERTRNSRIDEGLAGGTEGLFSSNAFSTARLDILTAHGEANLPGSWGGLDHVMTLGAEWVTQDFEDPNSVTQTTTEGGAVPGIADSGRSSDISARIVSIFIEDNIELARGTLLTPGVRFDHHDKAGANWSPSINLSHALAQGLTLKAGVARAYKAPNLYQLNPNYLLYSRGIGCWGGGGACYLQGNADLKAETSINKELGIEYSNEQMLAGLTLFHNDYRNKIEAGHSITGRASGGTGRTANAAIFRWDNVRKAVVSGVEGAFNLKIGPSIQWDNNLTYMIDSENRETGEQLSIIPEYTLNSRLGWQASNALEVFGTVTWYGRQKANKFDFQGLPLTGEEAQGLSPYALLGIGARYAVNKHLSVGAGVDNLLDKRLYRRGNAVGVNNPRTIYGAGAATYNEPGRAFYLTVSGRF
ncbi:MAG: TonB-dependent siderophore receptor [Lautropia sp.]|nr:TonB-dependent siderophore receptor [Lautropia sp.]